MNPLNDSNSIFFKVQMAKLRLWSVMHKIKQRHITAAGSHQIMQALLNTVQPKRFQTFKIMLSVSPVRCFLFGTVKVIQRNHFCLMPQLIQCIRQKMCGSRFAAAAWPRQ